MNAIVAHVIIRAKSEMKIDKVKLESEEAARTIAELQGSIAGYRLLISFIAAEFHIMEFEILGLPEEPEMLPDFTDTIIAGLFHEVTILRVTEEWGTVLARIVAAESDMKDFLLFRASKTHDLFFKQSQQKALHIYESVFNAIEDQQKQREKKAEEKRKNPEFAFEDQAGADGEEEEEEGAPDISTGQEAVEA